MKKRNQCIPEVEGVESNMKLNAFFSNTNTYLCDTTFFKETELQIQFMLLSAIYMSLFCYSE